MCADEEQKDEVADESDSRCLTVVFDRMAPDGSAMGDCEGRVIAAFGALPGDTASVKPLYRRKKVLWCELVKVIEPSPHRMPPREAHFTSCSPWQIMAYPQQIAEKHRLLAEAFAPLKVLPGAFEECPTGNRFGYRTKIEFSFTEHQRQLHLSFFKRGGAGKFPLPDGCELASARMNDAALFVRNALREYRIPARDLKTLIVRESKLDGLATAVLYVMRRDLRGLNAAWRMKFSGFRVAYSDPLSPASVETDLLYEEGETDLADRVGALRIEYPQDAFFQNNIPMFEKALDAMRADASALKPKKILDLYAGAGTIGLMLAPYAGCVAGVELHQRAAALAEANAELNGIGNYSAQALAAERIPPESLQGTDVLVLDPPRAGLHPKLIAAILAAKPPHIFYLSCNYLTQAHDCAALMSAYHIRKLAGFDFYPQTPHMESLAVLNTR